MTLAVYLRPVSFFPSELSSSSIFGAICHGIAELFGPDEIQALLPEHGGGLLLSSAFPFVEDGGRKVRFFPVPILKPVPAPPPEPGKHAKARVSYVQEDIFRNWVSGGVSSSVVREDMEKGTVKKGLLCAKKLDFDIEGVEVPHNLLNRLSSRSEEFFHREGASFRRAGLFFLLRCQEPSKRKVLGALRFLEDRGLGGDISGGFGQFKLELGEFQDFSERSDANRFVTLSLYLPSSDELDQLVKGMPLYRLVTRGGRCRDGVMKRTVTMFDHGSTFPVIDKEHIGRWVMVREAPPVLEWGLAYPVKFHEVQA